jgi:hypothetical protein
VLAHNVPVFDCKTRIDATQKKRASSIFSDLNNSARPGCEGSRTLIEDWFSNIPTSEQKELRSRFRSGVDVHFASAFHELSLHELFLRQSCKPRQHPTLATTKKRPDFSIVEPDGSEFLLEARASTAISTGPDTNPRLSRVQDFLQDLKIPGLLLGLDELRWGTTNLSLKSLQWHIQKSLKNAATDRSGLIRIPAFQTDDGWKIRLTAISDTMPEVKKPTVLYQAWSHTWTGPSYSLHDALKEKARRYGSELGMPFVIAVNSFDALLCTSDFEESLFGEHGLWRTPDKPQYRRVSAVLFTRNLWPATVLMGQVESRLYLNPFAIRPYRGTLSKLDTFKFESGSWYCDLGAPLNHLLKVNLLDSSLWN